MFYPLMNLWSSVTDQKKELHVKVHDYVKHSYGFRFCMLTREWTDGNIFLLGNIVLLFSVYKKSRVNDANVVDKGSAGYKQCQLSMKKERLRC